MERATGIEPAWPAWKVARVFSWDAPAYPCDQEIWCRRFAMPYLWVEIWVENCWCPESVDTDASWPCLVHLAARGNMRCTCRPSAAGSFCTTCAWYIMRMERQTAIERISELLDDGE